MVPLTPFQQAAVAAVRNAWPDVDIALVGALAVGCHIKVEHRKTNDLDLVVPVGTETLYGVLAALDGWTQDPKIEHRFATRDGELVDVLPASPALIAQGYIEWPSGHRMSLAGFDLAFAHGMLHEAGDKVSLWVPSAPALTFLKMCAWLDRPEERKKDLGDLAHLMDGYLGDDDDRRWSDEVMSLGLDFDDASPFLLGRDLGDILRDRDRPHLAAFLTAVTPEKLSAEGPTRWFDADRAEQVLRLFIRGLDRSQS